MTKKDDSVRKSLTISKEIDDYYKDLARKMGTSQSSVMAMALYQQIKQEETISAISDFEKLVQSLETK